MNNVDDDFKDLEEKEYPVSRKNLFIIIGASLLITLIYIFHISGYFFTTMLPLMIILGTYLIIFKDEKQNKKAYFMLIPIFMIMISDLIIKIDLSNQYLSIVIVPILLCVFMLLLLNKNYHLKDNFMMWVLKLFPKGLFSNLKYVCVKSENKNTKQISNIIKGIGFGLIFCILILYFLSQADDYFSAFINSIFKNLIEFDPLYLFIFTFSFILSFSVLVNILKNRDNKMQSIKTYSFDKSLITTILVMVNSVFVLFLISEISRLTVNFLQLPIEYTYSSYAREGFFQLLFVTLINFSLISFLTYKTDSLKKNGIVRLLITILIVFSIILIFNSYYRMYLYINHFGFTVLRMQVILFLLMELIIFSLLIIKNYSKVKRNDALICFIIIISFYIINLYLCNNTIIGLFS